MFSRDAQIVALSLFRRGTEGAMFSSRVRISERSKKALDELVELGAVKVELDENAAHYKAVYEVLGKPYLRFEPPTKEEDFSLTSAI